MQLIIVGTLNGQIGAASQIAIKRGAKVQQADTLEDGLDLLRRSGADLVMITQDGYVFASSILSVDRSQSQRVALSSQINAAVNEAVRAHGALPGWQALAYAGGQMLIFNVPPSATTAVQHVFNTNTRRPCRFTGIDALCWGLLEGAAHFGTADGRVCRFDTGTDDAGAAIAGEVRRRFRSGAAPRAALAQRRRTLSQTQLSGRGRAL